MFGHGFKLTKTGQVAPVSAHYERRYELQTLNEPPQPSLLNGIRGDGTPKYQPRLRGQDHAITREALIGSGWLEFRVISSFAHMGSVQACLQFLVPLLTLVVKQNKKRHTRHP